MNRDPAAASARLGATVQRPVNISLIDPWRDEIDGHYLWNGGCGIQWKPSLAVGNAVKIVPLRVLVTTYVSFECSEPTPVPEITSTIAHGREPGALTTPHLAAVISDAASRALGQIR